MRPERSLQGGFGVIAAIVILVIFAGLSAFIVSLSSSQQLGAALDVQGSNAYLAANAGIEWGKFQTASAACSPSTTLTINGYTVVITCATVNSGAAVEAGLGSIYSLVATACNNTSCPNASPGPLYVERKIAALIER